MSKGASKDVVDTIDATDAVVGVLLRFFRRKLHPKKVRVAIHTPAATIRRRREVFLVAGSSPTFILGITTVDPFKGANSSTAASIMNG